MRSAKRPAEAGPAIDVTATVSGAPRRGDVVSWAASVLRATGGLAEVSILLCGDARMRRLNREYRKKDRPTDVLSFPSGESGFLGDLAIDVPYAARQARRRGHAVSREIQILLVHGLLHLRGYDHETDDGEMFELQGKTVRRVFGSGPDGVP